MTSPLRVAVYCWPSTDGQSVSSSRMNVQQTRNGCISEARNLHLLPALERRLMRADAYHRPVDGRLGVRQRRLFAEAGHQEIVDQVRMRTAVAASLQEREVLGVLDCGRLREAAEGLRRQVREVRPLDARRDLRFAQRLLWRALGVDDRFLVLHLLPLERL